MKVRFNGTRNPKRYRAITQNPAIEMGQGISEPFRSYTETVVTWAVKVDEPFEVHHHQGMQNGEAGDYLAMGPKGELSVLPAKEFQERFGGA